MFIEDGITYEFRRLYRCVELSRAMLDKPNGNFLHFSFVMQGTRVHAIGFNDVDKSGVRLYGKFWEYPLKGLHSETSAISKLDDLNICRKATLVNVRLNKKGQLRNSKPCEICQAVLNFVGLKKIYYSTESGFERLYL